jgi:hypothetical protein
MFAQTTAGMFARVKKDSYDYSRQDEIDLARYIRETRDAMVEAQDDFHRFHLLMRDLEKTLLRNNHSSALHSRAVDHLDEKELELLNNLYCLWETNLESRFVHYLKQGVVSHYLDYPLYARFERLIEREVGLLEGKTPKRLLFIGSGPMPITALCLRHRLGVPIDCLERNQDAVDESKAVMKLLGCENAINVFQGYGEDVDASQYDIVLVALLAKPKFDILANIRDTSRDDIQVICRTSEGSRKVFYEPTVDNAIPPGLETRAYEMAGIDDTISSYLLKKN